MVSFLCFFNVIKSVSFQLFVESYVKLLLLSIFLEAEEETEQLEQKVTVKAVYQPHIPEFVSTFIMYFITL
jgi:hypothetical protein